jgi:hypothetical protein
MTTTEAPYSFNVKAIDRAGFDAMFTIRDEDGQQFFQRVTNLLTWLPANGYTPTGNGRRQTSPADQAPQGAAPICNLHNRPMKPSKYGGWYCPAKLADNSYCQEKVDGQPTQPQPPAPMPQPAAIQYAVNGTPPPPAMFDSTPPPPPDYDYYGVENN